MCFTLTDVDAEIIMNASSKIWAKYDWHDVNDVIDSVLACELLDVVPGITTVTPAELDLLENSGYFREREVIEELQKEYTKFVHAEKEVEFRKFRKC